jgi:hypothetical protein
MLRHAEEYQARSRRIHHREKRSEHQQKDLHKLLLARQSLKTAPLHLAEDQ